MVKGLRRRPLTAETGVRFPYRLLRIKYPDEKIRERLRLRIFFLYTGVQDRTQGRKEETEPEEPTTKTCPYCRSEIALEAVRCPHCTSEPDKESAQ